MNERTKALAEQAGMECSLGTWYIDDQHLERFAELVAAAEREACAKLCGNVISNIGFVQSSWCVQAIEARGDKHE